MHSLLTEPVDPVRVAAEAVSMRRRLEASRPRHDLKRGPGGLVDLEFIVQYLLLVHAPSIPDLLRPNFWDALDGAAQAWDCQCRDSQRAARRIRLSAHGRRPPAPDPQSRSRPSCRRTRPISSGSLAGSATRKWNRAGQWTHFSRKPPA